uniref:Band 7 domain-containing protein n=1 Tax=Plectus sambesii TaxID=2011161 RepID=A0A914URE9_9BILA
MLHSTARLQRVVRSAGDGGQHIARNALRGHRQPFLQLMQPSASAHQQLHVRFAHTNTIINFVPQQEAWVVERMGRFHKILEPGFNVLIPVIDRIKYVQSLKEIAIEIPQQGAITVDNVALQLDGVLYLKVLDPYKVRTISLDCIIH